MDFFKRVKEYYPTYLSFHKNVWTRRFHFAGQIMTFSFLYAILEKSFTESLFYLPLLLVVPTIIYLPAWFSHFVFEKNKPATWTVDWKITKACDLLMAYDMIRGKIPF